MPRPSAALRAFAVLICALTLSFSVDATLLPASLAVARFDPGDHNKPQLESKRAVDSADWQGGTAPFDRAASGSGVSKSVKRAAARFDPGDHAEAKSARDADRAGGFVSISAGDIASSSSREGRVNVRGVTRVNGGGVSVKGAGRGYVGGGGCAGDSGTVSSGVGARWVPGDDAGESLETVWVR
ncbi:hypothetical protein EIP86_006072 [Pleurotus ostreatoroseus]|nr:hypothetical protein EIP86_006072 [Pleurotus ostreatoroseus]